MKRPANVMYLAMPAVLAAGCSYSPGNDYGVVASWFLNGAAPTTERCREQGIETVRLTMDGPGEPVTIEAPCDETLILSDGLEYGAFETTVSFDFEVGYKYDVAFLDKKGKSRYGYSSTVVAYYGDYTPVELDTVDVFEPRGTQAELTAAWVFSGGTLDSVAEDCTRNGIEKIALSIASVTDPSFRNAWIVGDANCDEGSFVSDGAVLATGDYLLQYVALDARGAAAERGEPIAVYVDQAGTVDLPRQTFAGI
jgi:hypothetical protein